MQIKLETSLRINVNSRREVRANTNSYGEDAGRKNTHSARDWITNKDIWDR